MHLQRKLLFGIQNLNQQRKPPLLVHRRAEQVGAMILHQPAKILPGKGPGRDDADIFWPIADFPRLANRHTWWQ
jgi:hypothetical protein